MKRKMTHKSLLSLFCVTVLLGTASAFLLGAAQTGSTGTKFKVTGIVPTRNQPPAALAHQPASSTTPFNGIQYLGGPVMNNAHGTNVYFIWYGNWSSDPAAQSLMTDFISHIGGTAYFNINSSYYDYNPGGEKDPVVNRINYGGSIVDNYSLGAAISDNDLANIIFNAVLSGKLPNDPNTGVYFVLTSADVIETSGFCVTYCAFHGSASIPSGETLIGGFIGNPDQCPSGCSIFPHLNTSTTPNNNFVGDSMVNFIGHELSETVTDPFGTSWVNPPATENGDLCNFNFGFTTGQTKLLPNGSYYNVKFGGRPWLIQKIWVNARGGYCALALDE